MSKTTIGCVLLGVMMAGQSMATTVWNPFANGHGPAPAVAPWGDALNWTAGVPTVIDKGVFNVPNAADAEVSGSFSGMQIVQGDGADGGVIRVLNGGSLSTDPTKWAAVGYNAPANAIVDAGGTYSFGQHAWIGFLPGAVGTLDISGTVNVGGMIGLGWSGGDGFVNVLDGGLLALSNIHGDGMTSIKQNSIMDIIGTGQVTLPGDFEGVIATYAANGLIAGDGIIGNIKTDLTTNPGFTTVTVPEPSTLALVGLMGLGLAARRKR